ncbi:hypothetical protein FH972_023415 [Carpinus fangiana]|uniref:Uncharacterized protein n=1 Tax=Carpinus fangiana TaxID=176857 RepID=A0A5N6KVL1_9ROSI|nr:hypothetical protein FH972_023415 [Carpinus fangiana]
MAPSRSGMGEQGDLGSVGNVHKLTKPPDLDTQAHNLLWKWKSIRPFVQNILKNPDEDYVLAAEESRGVLKLFGAAPSHHRSAEGPTVDSPAAASDFSDSGTSGESWGQAGSRICNFSPVDKYTETLPGGYNSRTGYIQLDRQTIERLYHSYLEHLHVLHPFINQDRVNHTIDKIFAHHSMFAVPDSASSSFDMRREASSGQKRKWGDQDATSNGKSTPRGNNSNNSPYPPPAKLERSPDMAILLLICALGRVCEEKGDLNVSSFNMTDYYTDSGAPSPLAGMSSPAGNTPRSASFPSVNSLSKERKNRTPMNVDTHPGLVYYAEAKEILGNMTGNHSMAFVHANLLAGLYMAQFVRILESYRSIHDACVSCIILINQLAGKDPQKIQDNYVRLTFWSCLQMESDILAELSFPKSGITEYEDKFPLPDTGDQKVMLCYSAQITLRKILNRSTWYLFDGNHPLLNNPKRSLDQLEDMVGYLDGWRQVTASLATSHGIPELAWEDSDEPATDINIARMRGKYYGAKYIIHRPFLKHILHQEEFNKTAEQGAATYGTPQAGLGQTESEDYARIVAHANTCVNAAIQSTYAFDGYRKQYGRLLVTNIFGTAHAQFGNTLVLSATSRSRNYHWMVKKHQLENLLIRTIEFFKPLAKLSSTMLNDLKILYNTKRILNAEDEARHTGTFTNSHAMSASHSFQGSAPSSMSQSFPP